MKAIVALVLVSLFTSGVAYGSTTKVTEVAKCSYLIHETVDRRFVSPSQATYGVFKVSSMGCSRHAIYDAVRTHIMRSGRDPNHMKDLEKRVLFLPFPGHNRVQLE